MDIKKTLLVTAVITALGGCSLTLPLTQSTGVAPWKENLAAANRSPEITKMPSRMDMAKARLEKAKNAHKTLASSSPAPTDETLKLQSASADVVQSEAKGFFQPIIKTSLAKPIKPADNTSACANQRDAIGTGLRSAIDERMALYMIQSDSLSESTLEPKLKSRLLQNLSNEFQDLQKKSMGLDYLKDTLHGMCQMHNLGLIGKLAYNQNTQNLLKTAAENLKLKPIGTKLRFSLNSHSSSFQKASSRR